MRLPLVIAATVCLLCFATPGSTVATDPPTMLFQSGEMKDPEAASGARTAFAIMRLPDGGFAFYDRYSPRKGPLTLPDADGMSHVLLPHLPKKVTDSSVILDSGVLDNTQVILGKDGEVRSVTVRSETLDRETAAKVGLPRYLNVWIQRANAQRAIEPLLTWRGYNGSQMEYQQLSNGRLLVPHGSFQPHGRTVPPHGRHKTVVEFSDDGGATWSLSASELTSPCYPGFNGSNEGACEPAFEELRDGRVWMLMRTQAGFLYESFSTDNGTTWTPARASRFNTSTGPPNIMRHRDGRLVVCWNNCEMPPRHNGDGVYGGRDALHIAISDDDGRTWRGFREIYLDHRRNENPAGSGDRGTAYPLAAFTSDGSIVVLAGQGTGGRNPILISPDWITATEAECDFSDGLRQWSAYKHYGPAKRWWRARVVGCELIPHPSEPARHCLHIRKPDNLPADGAVWNFPNGWKGSLTARILIRRGFHGAMISLLDRFFDPANDLGEEFAVFKAPVTAEGQIGSMTLTPGEWADLRFDWDLSKQTCQLSVNEHLSATLPLSHKTLNGLSYLRLRSSARDIDPAGFLLDRVRVSISDPAAPACSSSDLAAHEQRYIHQMVPRWASQSQ
jgi:hypothetical protein